MRNFESSAPVCTVLELPTRDSILVVSSKTKKSKYANYVGAGQPLKVFNKLIFESNATSERNEIKTHVRSMAFGSDRATETYIAGAKTLANS